MSLRWLNGVVFRLFVINIFFVHYQTKYFPGTVHTWLMLIGLFLLLPSLAGGRRGAEARIPRDYLLVCLLLMIILAGYLVNMETATWSDLQAYVLMLATYVYVKENTTADSVAFLYSTCKYFLIVNGIFMMLQLVTGKYFPAALLAAGDPPLAIASGVSDGPTKNGMLILFALSFMYARFVFQRLQFAWTDMIAFVIGAASIFLATSRAGVFGFVLVILLGGIFAVFQALRNREFQLSRIRIAIGAAVVIGGVIVSSMYGLSIASLYDVRDSAADRYGVDALMYKLTVVNDDSLGERFESIRFFFHQIGEFPLQIASVGFGAGTFETLFGKNIHNSYLELLFTTGAAGFLVFAALVAHVLRKASISRNVVICPAIFALVSMMMFMATHDVLRGRVFWIALGVIGAFAYSRSEQGRSPLSAADRS